MKRVLWLVSAKEIWMATECCPRLAPGLRAAGFDVVCPVPPTKRLGPVRLAAHYWNCLPRPSDLVHAFDPTVALMACLIRGSSRNICLDMGLAAKSVGNSDWMGIPTVYWGAGGAIPWPPEPVGAKTQMPSTGNLVGFDSSVCTPNLIESVVWSLEIARQVVPHVQLAPGHMVAGRSLVRFANAVGARGALAQVSCEQAMAEGALKGILLSRPDRRVVELAINALKRGIRVAWITSQVGKDVAQLPASDPPLAWRDRTGLARLLLEWERSGPMSVTTTDTQSLGECTQAIAAFYRGLCT